MTHTPGHWRIQNANDDYTRYQVEADGWGIIMRVEDVSNESLANARLIAAAPEMLVALEAVCQAFANGELKFTKRRNGNDAPYHPANVLLTAALAKVKGE